MVVEWCRVFRSTSRRYSGIDDGAGSAGILPALVNMAPTPDVSTKVRSLPEGYAEAQRYFVGQGILNYALEQLVADLRRHDIDYAVIGGVALFVHGYKRVTENINLLLTPEGLEKFRKELLGRGPYGACGYDQTEARKRVRSHPYGIVIEIATTGEYPGDGKPKPVSMPEPRMASIEIDGVQFVTLAKLIELKLASGISAADRLKDLADVQELIKIGSLQKDFAERLDPYVRDKFLELFEAVEKSKTS